MRELVHRSAEQHTVRYLNGDELRLKLLKAKIKTAGGLKMI